MFFFAVKKSSPVLMVASAASNLPRAAALSATGHLELVDEIGERKLMKMGRTSTTGGQTGSTYRPTLS